MKYMNKKVLKRVNTPLDPVRFFELAVCINTLAWGAMLLLRAHGLA